MLKATHMTSECLSTCLEDVPFQASLKRTIGFHLLSFAIEKTEVTSAQRLMTLLTWFQRAMRYKDMYKAHYLTGLPLVSIQILESIQKQFKKVISVIQIKIG